jgi:hypothetical protein
MYAGVHFDSDEEVYVAMWLEELKSKRLVKYWEKYQESFPVTKGLKVTWTEFVKLKTKTKTVERNRTLLRPSEYTPDFKICFTEKGFDLLCCNVDKFKASSIFYSNNSFGALTTFLEVKPSFDMQNMERLFVNNQKFIWDKYQIFVNLVEPMELFKKTFLPLEAASYFRYKIVPKKAQAKGKKVGDWKMDWTPKKIKQFLNETT